MPYLEKYKSHLTKVVALLNKARRYRGDTTMHVAASRGFTKLYELIIGIFVNAKHDLLINIC